METPMALAFFKDGHSESAGEPQSSSAKYSDALSFLSDAAEAPAWQLLDVFAIVHECDAAGRIVGARPSFCAATGYSAEEIISGGYNLLRGEEAKGRSWLDLHALDSEMGVRSGETLFLKKDGRDLWLSSKILEKRSLDGSVSGYVAISTDVTECRKIREELQRNSKLMQLGQLAATVAHEIRNPLGAIRTANFVLQRKLEGNISGVEAQIERINKAIGRCDKIISEMLDFSRQKAAHKACVSVDAWVSSLVGEEAGGLLGAPEVTCKLGLSGLEAVFDADQMRQVLVNLLSNAAEAMAERTMSPEQNFDAPQIVITTSRDGDCFLIEVADNGPGISAKNLHKIREPLFTTKSFGVGLGLPAVIKILENHNGGLDIESEPGSGTKMTARIPLAAEKI